MSGPLVGFHHGVQIWQYLTFQPGIPRIPRKCSSSEGKSYFANLIQQSMACGSGNFVLDVGLNPALNFITQRSF